MRYHDIIGIPAGSVEIVEKNYSTQFVVAEYRNGDKRAWRELKDCMAVVCGDIYTWEEIAEFQRVAVEAKLARANQLSTALGCEAGSEVP